MEQIIIKKDLVKITGDFTLGVILNEIIEIAQKFRKEFIDNNWHCPEFFELNIEKISEDNMLNLSKYSIRRYIKKLENLGFISVDKLEKKHRYRVNFDVINRELEKIGGELIKKFKPICKGIKEDEKLENSKNIVDEFDGFTQTTMFEGKEIAPSESKELSQTLKQIQNNINYSTIEQMRQDRKNEHFVNMFDGIYNVIVDIMTTNSGYIKVNKQDKPIEVVKGVFSKITSMDVTDIIEKMKRVETKIINIKSYLITTIYNHQIEKTYRLQNDLYTNLGLSL